MTTIGRVVAAGAVALATAGSAGAATFGPATGAIAILGSPTVTLGTTSGTESFNSPVSIFGTTGSLMSASGSGSVLGTLDFSNTVGTVTPDAISGFMTFADTSGGDFTFNVASVQTLGYSHVPGVSTSITLYLLGSAGDSKLGLAYAPTSETITVNQTGKSAYSGSASIASPPALGGVPEPATWALLMIGFGFTGAAMRQRSGKLGASA